MKPQTLNPERDTYPKKSRIMFAEVSRGVVFYRNFDLTRFSNQKHRFGATASRG